MNKISNEKSILSPLTEDQWKVMSEIGYPYAPGNAKANDPAPVHEMIYWRLAAGFISQEDAVRAFSTTGYTVGEDPQRTREILSELNSQYGKLATQQEHRTNKNLSKEMLAEKIKTSGYWTEVEDNNFPDKVVFNNNAGRLANGEKVLCFDCEWEETGDLHIVSYFNPNRRNLFTTEDGYLVKSKIHTSTIKPAYLTFEKTEIRVFDTTIRQDQQKELSDAKPRLINILDSASADLGDTILIQPTTVRLAGIDTTVGAVFLAPDGRGGGEFRLSGEDYAVLAVEMNGHTEFNACKILDTVASIDGLAKAVHDVHVAHLEQGAKHAIRDRIVTPAARSFTSEQVEVLNRYHQVAAPDKPAGEVFKELLDEVAQDSDVARKPEKWFTNAARELDDLAEGITREESRGLHK